MSGPLDLEYLVAWSLERQQEADRINRVGGDRCRRCGHGWHGVGCGGEAGAGMCTCESAWEPRTFLDELDGSPPPVNTPAVVRVCPREDALRPPSTR